MFTLVRAGFNQRRKMLRRSLVGLAPAEAFGAAGIAETARAEELSIEDWGRLADAVASYG
jgi:16S rRNA (adenine1518-N6/adenine1519-N6)-dimethyltransferase